MKAVNTKNVLRFAIGLLLTLLSLHAKAEQADFYKGKTVRIVVGYSPGGGFDAYARAVAPRLASELGAAVVVENKPGAGGLNAFLTLTRDKGDGLHILLLNGEPTLLSQIADPKSRYDISKLALLGRISFERRTLVVRKNSAYEKIEAFQNSPKPLFFGAGDRIDSFGDAASIFCATLKLKCKLVLGFPGASDIALAVARGELDAFITSGSQATILVNGGAHSAVAVLSSEREELLPNVPTLKELTDLSPAAYKWVQFRSDIADFGRVFVVPVDTPRERVDRLRRALRRILTNPEFIKLAEKANRPVSYASPDKLEKTVEKITTGLSDSERLEIRHILLNAY